MKLARTMLAPEGRRELVIPADWETGAVEILLQVTESMTSAEGVTSALNRLARLALKATAADRCAIFVRDTQGGTRLIPAAGASAVREPARLLERFLEMDPIDVGSNFANFQTLWDPGRAVTLEDALRSPLLPEDWKREWQPQSLAFAPLRVGGDTLGIIAVDYIEGPHTFTPGEVRLLEAIANAAGVALRSARLVEQLQSAVSIERRLAACTVTLLSGGTLTEILDAIAENFVSLLPHTSCSIYVIAPDGTTLRSVAHRGPTHEPQEIRLADLPSEEVDQIIEIWRTDPHLPLVISDTSAYTRWKSVIPDGIGTGMLIAVPAGDEILGVVAVGRPETAFSPEEVRVAAAFANQASLALSHARLTEALQVRLKLIESLARLSDAVVKTSNLKAALSTLNRNVGSDVGLRCVRLSFGDPMLARVVGTPTATEGERTAIRAWRSLESPEPIDNGDALGLPVSVDRGPAGILWVRPRELDRPTLDLARAIAVGLGEVALKAKLRRTSERRTQELAVAEERERIARDLHDTVGQTLYGFGLKMEDLLWDVKDPVLRQKLTELRGLAGQGLSDVRSAVYALSFLHVKERGFIPSLRGLAREFTRTTGIPVDLRVEGTIPGLHDDAESALYRLAHEALVNVERHARATGIVISIDSSSDRVQIVVRDDGVGLTQRNGSWRSHAHFGMRTMARSVEEIGGTFSVIEGRPRGLIVRATVPFTPPNGGDE